ncbi:hypothetical protein YPPY72_1908, partial [Yersinia pestis PY-72]
MRATTSALSK